MVSIQYWNTVSETKVLDVPPQYSDITHCCVSLDPRLEPVKYAIINLFGG